MRTTRIFAAKETLRKWNFRAHSTKKRSKRSNGPWFAPGEAGIVAGAGLAPHNGW